MMRNDSPAIGSGSNQSSNTGEEAASNIEVVEDPDLVGLRAICVPKRKMPLPVKNHKKRSAIETLPAARDRASRGRWRHGAAMKDRRGEASTGGTSRLPLLGATRATIEMAISLNFMT
uniref:Uncharacterized protein n=1 Tax=Oryza brachyantha TaxID=4533 RepID=J3LFE4_ORYBR